MTLTQILLFLCALVCVYGYPNGAPSTICGRFVPGHRNMGTPVGNGPRNGPFTLTATPQGNGLFRVTLRATSPVQFKGFLIQSTQSWKQLPDNPGDVVGMFQPDSTGRSQIRRCATPTGSNAITHTSNESKEVIEVNWRAPVNLPNPGVKFMASVVVDYDNFYVVHSAPIQVTDDFAPEKPTATLSGNTVSPFNSFQGMKPTDPPATQPTTVTGAPAITAGIGGGLSVISNDQFTQTVTDGQTSIPVLFSVTDSPPPPIILPDGRISSHSVNNVSNKLLSDTLSSNSFSVSPVETLVASESSDIRSLSLPPADIRSLSLLSSDVGSLSLPSFDQGSLPLPSSDPMSKVGLPGWSSLSRTLSVTSPSPDISRTFPPFTTVDVRPVGSVQRPVPPTKPVATVDQSSSPSLSVASSSPWQSLNSPISSSSSTSVKKSLAHSQLDTIVVPVNTPNDISPFEPLNFADIRAPSPTVSKTTTGMPEVVPLDTLNAEVNQSTATSTNTSAGPVVQIINLPILPEGQRAALIDVLDQRPPETSLVLDTLSDSSRSGNTRVIRPGRGTNQGQGQGQGQFGQSQGQFGQGQGQFGQGQGQFGQGQGQFGQGQGPFGQGQGQFGQGQQFNQGLPGRQFNNRFGQQTRFGQQGFGMQGGRNPFNQQFGFRQGQGQMFGNQGGGQGQFGGRMPNQQFGGLNLPVGNNQFGLNLPFGGPQLSGQSGINGGQGQSGLGGQTGQQPGSQPNPNGAAGGQTSSSNLFGGQFGTPTDQQGQGRFGQTGQLGQGQGLGGQTGQQPGSQPNPNGGQISSSNLFGGQFGTPTGQQGQGQFGQTGQFNQVQGQGLQGRNPFAPPGFNAGGRIQFNGFGQQQQQGQFGGFGQRQFGNQGQFTGQGPFRGQGQGQFGQNGFNTFGRDPFGMGQQGQQFFNRGNNQGQQFGRNPFGPNQGTGAPTNQLNTFANVPSFGAGQGQTLGSQDTLTLGGQSTGGLNGQSSGSLFNQLSQPNDNSLNNFNTGNGNGQNNALTPSNDQNQNGSGSGGLSSFAFGPFNSNTK